MGDSESQSAKIKWDAEFLKELFAVAVNAARVDELLATKARVENDHWIYGAGDDAIAVPLPLRSSDGRLIVAGAGKAVATMARGLEAVLGERISHGAVVVKYRHGEALDRIRVLEAAHPIPDEAGFKATDDIQRMLAGTRPQDTVFFLLSGGASALLVAPAPGIPWQDKATVFTQLIRSPASIDEINCVRKHISSVKGGRLRQDIACAAFCTLSISDVIGDAPGTIGSGPTVPDPTTFTDAIAVMERHNLMAKAPDSVTTHLREGLAGRRPESPKALSRGLGASIYRVIASNRLSIAAVREAAQAHGCEVTVLTETMSGHTHMAAEQFARALLAAASRRKADSPPMLVIAGGETTLAVQGTGRGGRNQEFAMVSARALRGTHNVVLLSAGTDGTDGPTDAAGAVVDGETYARLAALGYDPERHLRENDVYPALDAVGALFRSGPTGTNVMDLVLGIAS